MIMRRRKKTRTIEVPMIDWVKDMWDTGDRVRDMEHFLGTTHAYIDRSKEKVVSVGPMLTKYALRVKLLVGE